MDFSRVGARSVPTNSLHSQSLSASPKNVSEDERASVRWGLHGVLFITPAASRFAHNVPALVALVCWCKAAAIFSFEEHLEGVEVEHLFPQ